MPKVQVLGSPSLKVFQLLNRQYEYDLEDLKYLQKKLLVTIKQDTYERAVDAMNKRGVISRGHRIALIRLVQQVQVLLQSANVTHWLIGDALRDAVCFGDLLQTTRHVELAVLSTQFKQLCDHLDLADAADLAIVRHASNPDIIAIQFKRYQGIEYPFVVLYSYARHGETYAYSYNQTAAIDHEELFPTRDRFLDYLAIPAPNKAYRFLRDQYPFFKHGLFITAFNKPLLVLFKKAVTGDPELLKTIKQQKAKHVNLEPLSRPRIQGQ